MSKKMLINASHPEENRVAIVVDGLLSELDIELAGQEQSRGNIFKAVVVRVETGLQAAFVDYGAEKLGFLQISEVHPDIYPAREQTKGRPRIADILRRGQEILVQVVKEERGNKGAALTTFLSLPGRYMVLMPDSTTKGVSRKITEEAQRKTLKKTMAELNLPEQMGYIVRTAGIGKEKEELKRDFDYLVRLHEGILLRKEQVKAPAQLYQESNLAIRSIRDYFSADMDEVLVDDENVFQDTKDFFALVMPELSHLVKRHRERRPIFSRYQIEEQIDALSRNQVLLPSGGSIVIDPTEALVAIDVNSGKMSSESGIEATAAKTNLEAAAEVGRQLRLRDLGGLIVIDFIDMRDRKHIREIEQELRRALKNDKARVSVGKISQFGLLEMSRQRIKPVLSVGSYQECPHCHGLGRIKSIEAQAVSFLRQAHTAAAKGQVGEIQAQVPYDVANFLLNQKRATISQLEIVLGLKVTILGRTDLLPGELHMETFKREKDNNGEQESSPVSHANQIEMALAEARLEGQPEPLEETDLPTAAPDRHEETEAVEETPPAKKKRRRRRKKPATTSDATATASAAGSVAEQEVPAGPEDDEQTTDRNSEPVSDNQATEQQTTVETKSKRRSRRARKPAAATKSAGEVSIAGTETAPQPVDVDKTPGTAAVVAEKKPDTAGKRPRRARKPAAKMVTETIDETAQVAMVSLADSNTQAELTDTTAETPPKRRTRRPRKVAPEQADGAAPDHDGETKTSSKQGAEGQGEEHAEKVNPDPSSAPATATKKPSQRRRRTTPAASAKQAEKVAPTTETPVE